MIKTFIKNALSLLSVVVLWGVYSVGYLSAYEALNALTVVVFVSVLALSVEDIATKAIMARDMITWQYAILMTFVVACNILWLYVAGCASVLQLITRMLLLIAAAGGTFAWAWYGYRISVMSEQERSLLIKESTYRKYARKFPAMSDEEVRKILSKALFCHLEGDSLEGRMLVDQPFDVGFRTLDELVADGDGGAAVSVASGYIEMLLTKRSYKEDK